MSKKEKEKEKSKNEEKENLIADAPETAAEEPAEPEVKEDPKDAEITKLKDQLLRNMAEYDNYRKRTGKERMELTPEITAKIVGEFLPVIDNIERALASECSDEQYKKGIEMIYGSFLDTLGKLGVEEIPTENAKFDPACHQAVQQVANEELESGTVATTFQKGYKIGDRILRFAMVAVVS